MDPDGGKIAGMLAVTVERLKATFYGQCLVS
jgi:hypothetical protein